MKWIENEVGQIELHLYTFELHFIIYLKTARYPDFRIFSVMHYE